MSCNWNENNLNPLPSINWRASLVPAAAVIPAPIAYIKVVAVKKLVVGFLVRWIMSRSKDLVHGSFCPSCQEPAEIHVLSVEWHHLL